MNRRDILKNLSLITGGALILPSCDFFAEKVAIAMNNLNITAKQEELLAELVGVIIPDGNIPGAKQLNVQDFVWVMVDDCLEIPDQKRFLTGLDQFVSYSRKSAGRTFSKLSLEKKTRLLQEILATPSNEAINNTGPAEKNMADVHFCIRNIKRFTVQGYLQSKYVMTEIMPYSLIPGSYESCKQIDKSKPVNIYA
jgi:hypothetical protein